MIYLIVPNDEMLAQGDILDAVPATRLGDDGEPVVFLSRAVVLTQTCDLAQGKTTRVVMALVHPAAVAVASGELKASTIRDHIRPGKVFGVYYLPAAPEPIPIPESLVDLRDLHTVPKAALEKLAAEGKRVARLTTPYREHLAQHFAVSYMRIALPEPYETKP